MPIENKTLIRHVAGGVWYPAMEYCLWTMCMTVVRVIMISMHASHACSNDTVEQELVAINAGHWD